MVDVSELIGRVEKATGPDRELDWQIADATNHPSFSVRFEHMWPPFGIGSTLDCNIPDYTASVDEALALVERRLPGWCFKLVSENRRYTFVLRNAPELSNVAPAWVCSSVSAPLAILSALLHALDNQNEAGRDKGDADG